MAQAVFGAAIRYKDVRIYRRKWAAFQPDEIAMTPNGNIYFSSTTTKYSDDFSRESRKSRRLFMHEMTHVYQDHQGVSVIGRRIREGGKYRYKILPSKSLNDYTIEQQAEIIADYYLCVAENDLPSCQRHFSPALTLFFVDSGYLALAEEMRRHVDFHCKRNKPAPAAPATRPAAEPAATQPTAECRKAPLCVLCALPDGRLTVEEGEVPHRSTDSDSSTLDNVDLWCLKLGGKPVAYKLGNDPIRQLVAGKWR